ncbi:oxysterol-binding protein-related protein 4C-like [Impatiens glandulifera]|uniref:oxysterol-binding protein-related protein 4C-like n=1 Tax=Impatiens glandulifera TaxID=253017 RepID=UPI001FB0E954|nr:oxysterol-binding protein-related protein 4C-like [Impatiens glandulifera]
MKSTLVHPQATNHGMHHHHHQADADQKLQVITNNDVVITAPLGLDEDSSSSDDRQYKAPNLLRRILSLVKNIRPGTSLISFQLPPEFNIPKSMLQIYGETVCCVNKEMIGKCNEGKDPIERFLNVLAWNLSTFRSLPFGVAPYNPILGETHHISRGSLNVLLEQVSHHPPVSALHATDDKNRVEIIGCHYSVPKFVGNGVDTQVLGTRELKLLNNGENYVMNHPRLVIRFLPVPSVLWSGNVSVLCEQSGLEARLTFGGGFFLGSNSRSVRGKIILRPSNKTLYEISGRWDGVVSAKDVSNGSMRVVYDAKEVLSGLKTPTLEDPQGLWGTDSILVWRKVNEGIVKGRWDEAREAKTEVEEKERALVRERNEKGESVSPKHFSISHTIENGWHCLPLQKSVSLAPLIVPI